MAVLVLDNYKDSFKDEKSFNLFKMVLIGAKQNECTPIVYNHEVVATLMSAEVAKNYLYERITKKILESPEVLVELHARLENESVVDSPL